MKSEFFALKVLKNRVSVNIYDARFFIVEEHTGNEIEYCALGFTSPVITIGPVSRYGLFRQLFNPLGYNPGSHVFDEKTDLRLNGSFNAGTRRGVLWEAFPDHLGLFVFTSDGTPVKAGGFFSVPLGTAFNFEGITMSSLPENGLDFEEWFSDSLLYPGGRLLHLGGKLDFTQSAFRLTWTSVASGAERLIPGLFSHLDFAYRKERLILQVLLGACSKNYFTPDGKQADQQFLAGSRISLNPDEPYTLSCSYRKTIAHPEILYSPFLESIDEITLESEAFFELGRYSALTLFIKGEKEVSYSDYGKPDEQTGFTSSILLNICRADFTIKLILNSELGSETESRICFIHSLDLDTIRVSFQIDRFNHPDPLYSLSLTLDLYPEDYHFYIRTWTEQPVYRSDILQNSFSIETLKLFSLTLGWELRC